MVAGQNKKKLILNEAQYLKIGTHLWVDRVFSNAVCSGMYHFHSSANAYMLYLNSAFQLDSNSVEFGRRQIWQAFVQESIRAVALASDRILEADHSIHIDKESLIFITYYVYLSCLFSLPGLHFLHWVTMENFCWLKSILVQIAQSLLELV